MLLLPHARYFSGQPVQTLHVRSLPWKTLGFFCEVSRTTDVRFVLFRGLYMFVTFFFVRGQYWQRVLKRRTKFYILNCIWIYFCGNCFPRPGIGLVRSAVKTDEKALRYHLSLTRSVNVVLGVRAPDQLFVKLAKHYDQSLRKSLLYFLVELLVIESNWGGSITDV